MRTHSGVLFRLVVAVGLLSSGLVFLGGPASAAPIDDAVAAADAAEAALAAADALGAPDPAAFPDYVTCEEYDAAVVAYLAPIEDLYTEVLAQVDATLAAYDAALAAAGGNATDPSVLVLVPELVRAAAAVSPMVDHLNAWRPSVPPGADTSNPKSQQTCPYSYSIILLLNIAQLARIDLIVANSVVDPAPAVDIEKATNGDDADTADTAVAVDAGSTVTWTYVVTNTGNTPLIDLTVTDDQGVTVDCGDGTNMIAALAVGESTTCTGTGTATEGDYTNNSTVTGTPLNPNTGETLETGPVTDEDPSHYTTPATEPTPIYDVALFKQLSDGSNTSEVSPGDTVTFHMTVINQGTAPISNIEVVDYLPAALTLNDPSWVTSADGEYATTTISGPVNPGDNIEVPITFTVNESAEESITNWGEVASMTDAAGSLVDDVDSTSDTTNTDSYVIDDEVNSTSGDEDDHDAAQLTMARTLAFTGASTPVLVLVALSLFAIGATLNPRQKRKLHT